MILCQLICLNLKYEWIEFDSGSFTSLLVSRLDSDSLGSSETVKSIHAMSLFTMSK